jgi:hypothetical protein
MAQNDNPRYRQVIDEDGNDFYCPTEGDRNGGKPRDLGECVEGDATRRYSGNLDVEQ